MLEPYQKPFWQVSVSQVRDLKRCVRFWCFRHAYGIRFTHPSAALGQEVHNQGEAFLKYGTPPRNDKPGKILRSGLQHLPKTDVRPLVECKIKTPLIGSNSVVFFGKIDALWLTNKLIVQDWKTSGNLAYAKTSDKLLLDLQFLLYSRIAMLEHGYTEAEGLWIYMQTKGACRSLASRPRVSLEGTEGAWIHFNEQAQRIIGYHKQGLEIQDTPLADTEDSCRAFGGCPYQQLCHQRWTELKGDKQTMSDILEQLMRETQQQQQQPQQQQQQPQMPQQQPQQVSVQTAAQLPVATQMPQQQPQQGSVQTATQLPQAEAIAQQQEPHYARILRSQPPLYPQGDPNTLEPQHCVVCGKIDNAPKTWTHHDYVPEYPNGFLVHISGGATDCLSDLLHHRAKILDGSIPSGLPLQHLSVQGQELTPAEQNQVVAADIVSPPEAAPPSVLVAPDKTETKTRKAVAKKKTAKEQTRFDALVCAVVSAAPHDMSAAQILARAEELWREMQ